MRVLFPVLILLAALTGRAQAQLPAMLTHSAAPAPAAIPAAATTPPLSPAETASVLQLLNDPQKRAAFTAQLQALTKATAATTPKPAAVPAVPLAPDSVGAEVIQKSASWLNDLAGQVSAFNHVLGNLPAVWAFSLRVFHDPARRAQVIQAAWHLGLILLVAAAIEWLFDRILRRPISGLARMAPGGNGTIPPPGLQGRLPLGSETSRLSPDGPHTPDAWQDGGAVQDNPGNQTALALELTQDAREDLHAQEPASRDELQAGLAPEQPTLGHPLDHDPGATLLATSELAPHHHRFSRTIRVLRRLPFFVVRLLLELLSPALFLALAYSGMIFAEPGTQAVLWVAISAYLAVRIATAITRSLVSPEYPSLRMVHLDDQGAAYTLVWVRRLAAVAGFGYAATQIGMQFGLPAQARDAFLKAVALIDHLFLVVIVMQCRRPVANRIRSHASRLTIAGRVRNRIASVWHLIAIFFVMALWLVWAAQVRNGYAKLWHFFVVSIGVLILSRLAGIVLLGGLDRAFRISPELSHRYPGLERRANRYYPLLRGFFTTLLFIVTFLALLQVWGVDTLAWFHTGALGGKLASAITTVVIAGAIALALWESVNTGLDRHLARLTRDAQISRSARLRTLLPILRTILMVILIAVFGLTALSEIGVNIAPLLAGAGIVGVAIGFGSQKLVQDFITGIFLLLENAMQVGDAVTVAGLSGSVENLSIRTMRLRAGDGSVHIIPFSSVSTVTNVNRGIGNAAVTVTVPIEEDTDHVSDVLSEIVRDMRGEQAFRDMMRSDFQLWGVDKVDAGNVTIVGQIVCTDSGRWAVQREFNRRMNIRFKELGIRIGTPVTTQLVVQTAGRAPENVGIGQEDKPPPANQVRESPPPSALGNTS
jgi:small-conductance mechanosensitive channel